MSISHNESFNPPTTPGDYWNRLRAGIPAKPGCVQSRALNSPEETEALGETWGREATCGMVIGLAGELGAGKTRLVKGLARGLGTNDRVHSPTFALLNEYHSGRFPLYHLDLYRLETPDLIINAGLEEYLVQPNGVSVVEWIEHWICPGTALAPGSIRLACLETIGESERWITYEDIGA